MSDVETWLRSTCESPLTGEPGSFVPADQEWCPHCGDTNYDDVTRVCLTCSYPDHPCSSRA